MIKKMLAPIKKLFWGKTNNLSNKTRLALGVSAFILANAILSVLVLADDASIDQTLLVKWPGKPVRHDYVQYTLDMSPLLKNKLEKINRVFCSNEDAKAGADCKGLKVAKKVGCAEGDLLELRNGNAFFCNHILIGYANKTTKDGQPLDIFQYNGIVPEGKIFAYGMNKYSYDSRYYGFVDVSKVQRLKGLFDAKPMMASL